MPTEQCVFLILYIHSIYGILYMYVTKYGCVFLLLGSLPLAHNAQHSLVGRAGAIPPSRTTGPRCLYNMYPVVLVPDTVNF